MISIFFLLNFWATAYSDPKHANCTCSEDLQFIIEYVETNLPAYQVDITEANSAEYEQFKSNLSERAREERTGNGCYRILNDYVEFFHDNHSRLTSTYVGIDESKPSKVKKFRKSSPFTDAEHITVTEAFYQQYPLDSIRGIYQTLDGSYTIAVVPSKTPLRDYAGVILESKTKLWQKGQVKLEITKVGDTYEAYSYLRNHALSHRAKFPLENGVLGNTWYKTSKKELIDHSRASSGLLEFRIIRDSIAYLKISSFSNQFNAKIDSLYREAEDKILNANYLIVDLRDNGGGNDQNAFPFLKWMYTQPIQTDKIDLLVTRENIKKWQSWYDESLQDTINYLPEDVEWYRDILNKMKAAELNTFIVKSERQTIELEAPERGPKKVAILYNRNCASSCETPLFWAMQSEKTLLVGEHSGGYTGYGEIDVVTTPCHNFQLYYSMSKYEDQVAFEKSGIPPDYQLTYDRSWLDQTLELLLK